MVTASVVSFQIFPNLSSMWKGKQEDEIGEALFQSSQNRLRMWCTLITVLGALENKIKSLLALMYIKDVEGERQIFAQVLIKKYQPLYDTYLIYLTLSPTRM